MSRPSSLATPRSTGGPAVERQAELWFLRLLEPDCPRRERDAFERWRAASREHAAAYEQVERLWADSGEAVQEPAVLEAAERTLAETESRPLRVRRWLVPAAVVGAAVGVIALLPRIRPVVEPPSGVRHETAVGERRDVELPDGSSAVLDTGTVLVERFGDGKRRLDLERGRAHFRAAADPARPFVVHAQGGTVTAIGTEFQVRVAESEATVTLLAGQVAVAVASSSDAPSRSTTLAAGEQVTYTRSGGLGAVSTADAEAARGWTQGKLFVDNWPLADLLAEMNRYSDTQLEIGDPSLEAIRLSGVFTAGDQDTLILILEQGWPVRTVRRSEHEILLLPR